MALRYLREVAADEDSQRSVTIRVRRAKSAESTVWSIAGVGNHNRQIATGDTRNPAPA
jgi:hypothetical protein